MRPSTFFTVTLAAIATATPLNMTMLEERDNEPKFPGLPKGMDKKTVVPLSLCREANFVGCEWHFFKEGECVNLPAPLENQISSAKQKMGFTDKKEWWCHFYPEDDCKGQAYKFPIHNYGNAKKVAPKQLSWVDNKIDSIRCDVLRTFKVAPQPWINPEDLGE